MSLANRTVALAALLVSLLLAPLQAAADEVFLFLNIGGEEIAGGSLVSGMEGAIEVDGVSMKFSTNVGDGSRASSHRRILPVTITKRIDQTTPLLHDAWSTRARFESAELRFTRPGPEGELEHYYTVLLQGGHVTGIETKPPVDPTSGPPLEEVEIVFRTIDWTWEPTGVSATSTWEAP